MPTRVDPSLETEMAETPPIVKPVGVPRFVPEMVTRVPTGPDDGVNDVIAGGAGIKTQAAPALPLSPYPPTIAVVPSAERETELPCIALLVAPLPTSLLPCWVQVPAFREKTHAAPALLLSKIPDKIAVFPSAERETDQPWPELPVPPVPANLLPCCVHTPAERVKTHAAPTQLLSSSPPKIAVFPSAERETDLPCCALPIAPLPTSLLPCCVHTPAERVKTHAAPALLLSRYPPTKAVFPSAERQTELPCHEIPVAPLPANLLPCCVHTPAERT